MRLIDEDGVKESTSQTRLIDANNLKNSIIGTAMSVEQRNLFFALIDAQPREGYDEFEMEQAMAEVNYWRRKCEAYEQTIIKLAVVYVRREE